MPTSKVQSCIVSAAILAGPMSIHPLSASGVPDAIAVHGEVLVATAQASGVQVYECKVDASDKLAWQFREPVATLFIDGKTVGRHYAGPHWEMADGSIVSAKVSPAHPAQAEATFRCSSSRPRRGAAWASSPASRRSSASIPRAEL